MGGSSGGGGSGKIGYPDYVEAVHYDWLNSSGAGVVIDDSMVEVMNAALGASPFAAAVAYDPDADITEITDGLTDLETIIATFAAASYVDTLVDAVINSPSATIPSAVTEADITADVAAHEAQLEDLKDDRLTGNVLPRFEAGMRDINAVLSSAFVLGRALIETEADQEVTREASLHGSRLRIATKPTSAQVAELDLKKDALQLQESQLELSKNEIELRKDEMEMKEATQAVEFQRVLSQLIVEAYRIKIVAKKEEADVNVEYDVADARWDLEVFQYGANLLAAPGGGTAVPTGKKTTAGSVIGGGLSGAAAGAMAGGMMGGPILGLPGAAFGAIAGGLFGIGAGLLS